MSVVDLTRLQYICNGSAELERSLITLYLDDTAARLAALENHIQEGSWDLARREVHSIKGSSGNLGITGVQQDAFAVEEVCRSESVSSAPDALTRLRASFDSAQSELATFLERPR